MKNDRAKAIREFVLDNSTMLTMTEEEIRSAEKYEGDPERVLSVIRRMRANRTAEAASTATYTETKTLESLIKTLRNHRDFIRDSDVKREKILDDPIHSDAYKNERINELNERIHAANENVKDTSFTLLNEILNDRKQFDMNFFRDPKRLEVANNAINSLKNAGKHLTVEDFMGLTDTFYGDAAAARYIYAAVKDDAVSFKNYLQSLAVRTDEAFDKSRHMLESLFFSNSTTIFEVEKVLLEEAEAIGISLSKVDYSKSIASEDRIGNIEPEFDEAEALGLIRESMAKKPDPMNIRPVEEKKFYW